MVTSVSQGNLSLWQLVLENITRSSAAFRLPPDRGKGVHFTIRLWKATCDVVMGFTRVWVPIASARAALSLLSAHILYLAVSIYSQMVMTWVSPNQCASKNTTMAITTGSQRCAPTRQSLHIQVWLSKSFRGNHSFTNTYQPLLGQAPAAVSKAWSLTLKVRHTGDIRTMGRRSSSSRCSVLVPSQRRAGIWASRAGRTVRERRGLLGRANSMGVIASHA